MSNPPFSLEQATNADIPDLCKIFIDAFQDDNDTTLKYLHEADPYKAKYEMMKGALEHWMSRPGKCTVMKAVAPGGAGAVGWMCWGYNGYEEAAKKSDEAQTKAITPVDDQERPKEVEMAADNTPENIKRLKAVEDTENEYWDEILRPERKCMYIVSIAISPIYQQRGIASALIQWGTAQADRDGVACWVHSSDTGWRAFEKNGFKEERRLELELDDYAGGLREIPHQGSERWGKYVFRYGQRHRAGIN